MKYFVFTLAALGVPPLALVLFINRRWMKYAVWAMIAALTVYQGTAINFFSHEEYRGSSRGMEVSVVYLIGAALILAAMLKRKMQASWARVFEAPNERMDLNVGAAWEIRPEWVVEVEEYDKIYGDQWAQDFDEYVKPE